MKIGRRAVFLLGLYQVGKTFGSGFMDVCDQFYFSQKQPQYQDLYQHYSAPRKSEETKQWVAITGGSDGIGKALAFNLAEKGFNIAILARSSDKMR